MVLPVRHLLRAKDLADGRYFELLTVADLARAAGLSRAHFTREFRHAFGETPHQYLLTRRRSSFPPAERHIRVPRCIAEAYGRPQNSTFREVAPAASS